MLKATSMRETQSSFFSSNPSFRNERLAAGHSSLLIVQGNPHGRMIAGALLPPHGSVHSCTTQTRCHSGAEQQMIKAKSGVTRPAITHIVPECVDALFAMQRANRVRPTLLHQACIGGAAL